MTYAGKPSGRLTSVGECQSFGTMMQCIDPAAYAEEQQKLAGIIENSSDMIGIASMDGKILYLNRAGQKLVGLDSLEEVRSKTLDEFIMPHLRESTREVSRLLAETGRK